MIKVKNTQLCFLLVPSTNPGLKNDCQLSDPPATINGQDKTLLAFALPVTQACVYSTFLQMWKWCIWGK